MYVTLFNISTQTRTEHAKPTNPKSTKMSAITTNVLVSNLPSVDEPPRMPVGEYLYNKIEDLLKADPDRVAMVSFGRLLLMISIIIIISFRSMPPTMIVRYDCKQSTTRPWVSRRRWPPTICSSRPKRTVFFSLPTTDPNT